MNIRKYVLGFKMFAMLPDANHKGVFHFAGYQPGNHRPIYATWEMNLTAAGDHLPLPERLEVFSDASKSAQERKTEAMTSILLKSGCFEEAENYMKDFFQQMTTGAGVSS